MENVGTAERKFYPSGFTNMGDVLRRALKDAVYTISFTAYRGSAGTPFQKPFVLKEGAPGTLDRLFHDAGAPYSFLDFRSLPKAHWLRSPLIARPFGNSPMLTSWPNHFDALVFTDVMYPSNSR